MMLKLKSIRRIFFLSFLEPLICNTKIIRYMANSRVQISILRYNFFNKKYRFNILIISFTKKFLIISDTAQKLLKLGRTLSTFCLLRACAALVKFNKNYLSLPVCSPLKLIYCSDKVNFY